jgi:hypothetical protein
MAVQPIPEGYYSITPYIVVDDGERATMKPPTLPLSMRASMAAAPFRSRSLVPATPEQGRYGHRELRLSF